MKIGVISDLHLFNKTANIERALTKLHGSVLILIVGDIADRAYMRQYIFETKISVIIKGIHSEKIFCRRTYNNRMECIK